MIHPLLRLIVTQPQLLADHAQAYGGLVGAEIAKSVAALKIRVILLGAAFGLLAVAVVLGGVALMLWAVIPPSSLQAPWALIAAPGVPALIGIVCALMAQRQPEPTFGELKRQFAADMSMLDEVSAA